VVCGRYVTQRYLRVAYGDHEGCVQGQHPGSHATSVEVTHADSGSTSAKLTLVPTGGPYDGEKLEVVLVEQHGTWRVDALHANVPVGP
jgi:hypothetical protein